jgi:nickel-type superoxide dismutase maturation protease
VTPSVRFPLGRFRVEDDSMRPTLQPGDYVLVNRWAYRLRPPAPGDLVVVRDPEVQTRFLVKRISEVAQAGPIRVVGDNPARSRDSRTFGPIALDHIIGKVWIRVRK